MLTEKQRQMLLELIFNEQIHQMKRHNNYYSSDTYKSLEELKIKIKQLEVVD